MFSNPYINPFMQMPQAQSQQVVRVNGENGARTFQLAPNSSALLLDESGQIVWLVISDGAGYKTVSPYDITPHQVAQTQSFDDLESRIARLEEIVNGNTTDTSTARKKPKPSNESD